MPDRVRGLLRRLDVSAPAPPVPIGIRAGLSTLGIAVQGVQRLLFTMIIGRVAGPAVVGTVNSLFSLALFASLLWPSATGAAATKFVALARGGSRVDEARGVARMLARRTGQSAAACAALAAAVAWWALDADPGTAASVAALVLAYAGYTFVRGLQFGTGQIPRATAWDALMSVTVLVALLAVLATRSPALLLAPLTLGYVLFTIQGWPPRVPGTLPDRLRREVDGFVLLGVVGGIVGAGFLQLSMVVAGAGDTAADAGLYAVALLVANPVTLFARSLSLALFPSMAEAVGRGDLAAVRRQADAATRTLLVTMVPLFGWVALLARPLLEVLFGAAFAGAAPLVVLLLFAVLPGSITVAAANSLTSRSQRGMRVSAGAGTVGALIGVALWALLVPAWGVTGVAVGYLVGSAVITLIPFAVAWWWDRHRWTGLSVRAVAGVLLLLAALELQQRLPRALALDLALCLGLALAWTGVAWPDARVAIATVRAGVRRTA